MTDKKKRKELPPIPLSEWLILVAGILIFAATEGILFLKGFTNILLNSIAALLLAAGINYVVFGVQNKLKLISKAFASLLRALPLIPVALAAALVLALRSTPAAPATANKGEAAYYSPASPPKPMTAEEISEMLINAKNEVAEAFNMRASDIDVDNELVAKLFNAKIMQRDQEFSLALSKYIQASKLANIQEVKSS
jgi:hypothetical protein